MPYKPHNIDRVFDWIVNSSLYICTPSGPWTVAIATNQPFIAMVNETEIPKTFDAPYRNKDTQLIINPEEVDDYEQTILDFVKDILWIMYFIY